MAMHMQSFLNTETELGGRSDLPDEVFLALTAGGWPAIRSSTKLATQQQQHEVFVIEFSKEAPAALAPCALARTAVGKLSAEVRKLVQLGPNWLKKLEQK